MTDDLQLLFDAQVKRELQMNEEAIRDLRKATKSAEERRYASHTVYGDYDRRMFTLSIADTLRDKFDKLRRGKAMEGAAELVLLKSHLNWQRIAYIAFSTMLDTAGVPKYYGRLTTSQRKDKGLITTTELYLMLGSRIMAEGNLQHLRKHFRHKYDALRTECFTAHAGFDQRLTNIKRKVKKVNDYFNSVASGTKYSYSLSPDKAKELAELFTWIDWSHSTQAQVGSLVARVVNDVTGFFNFTKSFDEKGNNRNIFVFTKTHDERRDEIMRQAEKYACFHLPMLVPPKPWSPDDLGGYYFTGQVFYKNGIVRGFRRGTIVSELTYEFINRQQNCAFSIDNEVLEIQRHLSSKGWSILGENERNDPTKDAFRPYLGPDPWDIPKLPLELQGVKKPRPDATEEHKALYNEKKRISKQITEFHTRQEELKMLARPVNRFFRAVQFVENDPEFYFPWFLDWRGRCYPMVDALNPQGPEYMKSVINFGHSVPVDDRTDFWLCCGIASAAGQDKESFESRVAWTKANIQLVKVVAKDPLGDGFSIWSNMPEPWIFLRACIEWRRVNLENQDYTNIACLGQDATQSGLQLLGGMVLDHQTCRLVNCVPGLDKPQDAYGTVLAEAIRLIEEEDSSFPVEKIRGKRKLVKTPVMTKVYAAGHGTRVSQIRKGLAGMNIRLAKNPERNEEMIEYLTTKVEQAMINTIPGIDLILEWFQRVVTTAFERGVEDIMYDTASGNRVVVEYREPITKQVTTEILGTGVCMPPKKRNIERVTITVDSGNTNVDDVKRAVAANFTHGAGDATLLQLAFHDMPDRDNVLFDTTHDCVYAPPSSVVDEVHVRVREAFVKICKSNSLQKFATLNMCADIPPPIVGTYNPESVRKARYFFC